MPALLLANAAATLFMCGLIWLVQLVVYPGLAETAERDLPVAHDRHSKRITPLVLPVMAVELGTSLLLALDPPAGAPGVLVWAGAALAAGTWLATGAVQVPAHRRIAEEGTAAVPALVAGNWVRTALWSAHGAVVLALLATAH